MFVPVDQWSSKAMPKTRVALSDLLRVRLVGQEIAVTSVAADVVDRAGDAQIIQAPRQHQAQTRLSKLARKPRFRLIGLVEEVHAAGQPQGRWTGQRGHQKRTRARPAR